MKRIIFTLLFAASGLVLIAQNTPDSPAKNNINLNFFGDASYVSINYERLFTVSPHIFFSGKLGIGYAEDFCIPIYNSCADNKGWMAISHHITSNFGKRNNFFEIGLGGTLNSLSEDEYGPVNDRYLLYPVVGYRRQPLLSNKLVFRIFVNAPPLNIIWESITQPFIPLGFSFGITF